MKIKADFNPDRVRNSNEKEENKYNDEEENRHSDVPYYPDDDYKYGIKPNSQDDPNEFLFPLDLEENNKFEEDNEPRTVDILKKIDKDVK